MKGFLIKQTKLTFLGFVTLCMFAVSCSDTTSVLPIGDELKEMDKIGKSKILDQAYQKWRNQKKE